MHSYTCTMHAQRVSWQPTQNASRPCAFDTPTVMVICNRASEDPLKAANQLEQQLQQGFSCPWGWGARRLLLHGGFGMDS